MKKIWKTFSSTYPVKALAATSVSVFNLVILNRRERINEVRHTHHVLAFVLFLAMAFFGDRLLSEIFQHINLESHFRYSKVYNTTGQSDILLIGNSRGHAFYQPAIQKITNATTLNLSYNALPTPIARALVEDYYDLYFPPKKMIVEISMLAKTEVKVINEFKLYVHQSERIRNVIEAHSPKTAAAISVANLYSFNTEAFQRSLYYLGKEDIDWILDKRINAGMISNQAAIPEMTYNITKERMTDFIAFVDRARQNHTDVELVLGPFYPAFRDKIINLDEFISIVQKETGLKVHNYAGFVEEDQYFSDYMHLNKQGSIIFMNKLKTDGVL